MATFSPTADERGLIGAERRGADAEKIAHRGHLVVFGCRGVGASRVGPPARCTLRCRVELGEQHVGDAEHALLRHRIGEARVGHVAELVGRLAAEHVVGELRLRIEPISWRRNTASNCLRGLAQLLPALRVGVGAGGAVCAPVAGVWVLSGVDHRMTSSARSAPACFSASRIATRSDGAAPIAFTA